MSSSTQPPEAKRAMSSSTQPPKAKRAKSKAPQLKLNGIDGERNHLERKQVVEEIYATALKRQYVVIGSSSATGKTSLLQLLEASFWEFVVKDISSSGVDGKVLVVIAADGAQNAYSEAYRPFWEFVVKDISSSGVDGKVLVVIAATYDLETHASTVVFSPLPHIDPNITLSEASNLFAMFAEEWEIKDWNLFPQSLVDLSKFTGQETYLIGVTMAGIFVLEEFKNRAGNKEDYREKEDQMLALLRGVPFVEKLARCFALPNEFPEGFKDRLLDVVLKKNDSQDDHKLTSDPTLALFFRAGLLNKNGDFSTRAARW
eukprot:CAMPEP_0113491866 /NCGR_PEP_ID=MMETSP0014_2-20120614/27778_1 /TAXON_ID=2857 /ORGANISM="Nitzschia sp." /LENGTH=315 /DNA_ID=CAMNT_0000385673 /DNA_START=281 /DNA_END=1226 /DNA_ORIENTATION=- /assembly_acc=CAM_ASM_000159